MGSGPPAQTILLVEDDPALALGLIDSLEFEGFQVMHAKTGEDGLDLALSQRPACVILDLMLPGMNGYQVCEAIRREDGTVPIIMLTARGQEADKIRGLDSGADDYVTKPFGIGELVARIRAAVRRTSRVTTGQHGFSIGGVTVDPAAHTLLRDGEVVALSFYEAELLKLLYERLGEPVSRDEILDRVWGQKSNPTNRTVDNFVVKLRRKIEPNQDRPRHILTVYGHGYKLVP
ncbi:MAG: response regulator transcription factor [Myxococcales bacterium]|nr:response regulator transcription factor [Myxococcales bacterium]